MTEAAERLMAEVLRLPPDERAELALCLFDALGETTDELERAWIAEARQRLADLDAGHSRLSPWGEARSRVFTSR